MYADRVTDSMQAALDVAKAGHRATLVEKTPTVGGHMLQYDKTFPTLDCAACILTPKMVSVGQHENIDILNCAEATAKVHLHRGRQALAELLDPAPSPERSAASQELADRLVVALAKLGDRCKGIFRLKLDGKKFTEIAEILGVASVNTVYTWDHRCRQRLRRELGHAA